MEIRKLTSENFYELRDLLDVVFTKQNNAVTDFKKLFPRFFAEVNEYAVSSHYGAFEDGKLIGTAAMYPIDYVIGNEHIRLIANGNVAVDENYRGRGIMAALLTKINQECDKCADLCYLHGNAQRYGKYGYFGGGEQYMLKFTPDIKCNFTFSPMKKEETTVQQKISQSKIDYIVRSNEDFMVALQSHEREALSVFDENMNMIGYISLKRDSGYVHEFAFVGGRECEIFSSLASILKTDVTVCVSGYDVKTVERCKACADINVVEPALFRIINPERIKEVARKAGLDENTLYAPYLT